MTATQITRKTTTVHVHVDPAQGYTRDDILAAIMLSQHERALLSIQDVRRTSFGDLFVALRYDLPLHYAETQDAISRIRNLTGIGHVAVFAAER